MTMGDSYSAWQIDEKDFPAKASLEDQINFLIGYGILAPSTHNTQPWQFEVDGDRMILTVDPELTLPQADPMGRGLQISLGCCVINTLVAAKHFGLSGSYEWSQDGVVVTFREAETDEDDDDLFAAITQRYSAKLPYEPGELRAEHQERLLSIPSHGASKLTLFTDPAKIRNVAEDQAKATLSFAGKRGFFDELARWLRASKTEAGDGMPGFVIGVSNIQSILIKVLLPRFKYAAKMMAKKDASLVGGSSAVGFMVTEGDTPQEWFDAGRHYETLALTAAALGLAITPLAAMIESSEVRSGLQKTYDLPGKAQIFFRMGYSKHKPYHTPRREAAISHQ